MLPEITRSGLKLHFTVGVRAGSMGCASGICWPEQVVEWLNILVTPRRREQNVSFPLAAKS